MNRIDIERLTNTFPIYLSDVSKIQLARDLEGLKNNNRYFSNKWEGPSGPIQADGWNHFLYFDHQAGEGRQVAGIICSNSCDVDIDNKSLRDRNIIFAPVVRLDNYAEILSASGIENSRIDAQLLSIRRQEKTDLFYLPQSESLPECIAMLGDIQSHPLSNFCDGQSEKKRLFRLNNFGFYLFLMKLSIHFTRFGEKLDRYEPS